MARLCFPEHQLGVSCDRDRRGAELPTNIPSAWPRIARHRSRWSPCAGS